MNNISAKMPMISSRLTPSTTLVTCGVAPARASVAVKCSGDPSVISTPVEDDDSQHSLGDCALTSLFCRPNDRGARTVPAYAAGTVAASKNNA